MRALIAALLALRADSFHASTRQRSAAARAVIPERVPLDILYEDGDVIVINKPAGMIAQHSPGSVERAIAYHLNATGTEVGNATVSIDSSTGALTLLEPLDFDSAYSAFWGREILIDAKHVIEESAQRHCRALRG